MARTWPSCFWTRDMPFMASSAAPATWFVPGSNISGGTTISMAATCFFITAIYRTSPRRGENYVTRKIVHAAVRIARGLDNELVLGNTEAMRDWGRAQDYVQAMWLMLQHHTPDDFIVATGQAHSVQEFVELVFAAVN